MSTAINFPDHLLDKLMSAGSPPAPQSSGMTAEQLIRVLREYPGNTQVWVGGNPVAGAYSELITVEPKHGVIYLGPAEED